MYEALSAPEVVRSVAIGFVIGRALLYPHDGDVAAAVDAACALVHDVAVHQ